MTGKELRALRLALGWTQKYLAQRIGCEQSTIQYLEAGQYRYSKWLEPAAAVLQSAGQDDAPPPTRRQRAPKSVTTGRFKHNPHCLVRDCGTVLFPTAEAVPARWEIAWHVNCGGFCAECAARLGWGDVVKAKAILAQYPPDGFRWLAFVQAMRGKESQR